MRNADRSPRTRSPARRRSGRAAPRWSPRGRRVASRPSVAPTARAASSLAAHAIDAPRSATAPASTAPITHDSPTPPSPMTATARPGRHGRGLEHRPDAGRHAAADERRDRRIDAVGEGDRGRLRHDRRLGHRADRAVRQDRRRRRPSVEDGRAVRHAVAERRRVRARPRPGRAGTTGRRRTERATTARPAGRPTATRHARAHGLDDARALVAHRDRRRARPVAVADVQVRVADARRQDPDPDLAGARLGQGQLARSRRARRQPAGRRPGSSVTARCGPAPFGRPGRQVRDVVRPPHRGVDERPRGRSSGSMPATPASTASRATAIAIARDTARSSPTGG